MALPEVVIMAVVRMATGAVLSIERSIENSSLFES
jgi:hypothetical protein